MVKIYLSEVDCYLFYWIFVGSEGKCIFFNKKFNYIYKNICNDFFCNIKELFFVKL